MVQNTTKATIYLGSITLEAYRIPDGTYKLYAEAVAGAVGKSSGDLVRFLKGDSPQALPYKDYGIINAQTVQVENGNAVQPVPVLLAVSYWLFEAFNGNKKAQALAQAWMAESIDHRIDST